ncbi:MAG: sulfatase-like hydrolase/transferase [Clostridia bacterium]|nr:sulfatase-like hydrolase/transferase [Clostridia bacterium]
MSKKANKKPASKKNEAQVKKNTMSKSHIIISLLASFAFSFSFFIVGPLGFYFSESNRGFFENNSLYAQMVVPAMIIAAAIFFVIIGAILLLATGKIHTVMVSVITWLLVCGYLQVLFFNGWTNGLIGDGNETGTMPGAGIPNLIVWLLLGVVIIGAPLLTKGKLKKVGGIAKMVVVYLLVLVFAMQGAGLLETILNAPEETSGKAYLSTKNMFSVSKKDNIIVFIVDRFDISYYNEYKAFDSNFFADFDGFTSYTDNISLYARTYPAVTSILTGVENDFSATRTEYLKKAYTEGTFLKDVADAGYDVNLYTTNFYVYDDANDIGDFVDNKASASDSAKLTNPMGLVSAMISYSAYNFGPDITKYAVGISTNSFVGLAAQEGAAELYSHDDAAFYNAFKEAGGLTAKGDKNFSFIHLRGCHSPFNLNENVENVGDGNATSLQQTRAIFKIIKEYIAELKAKGLYEDATIIITGDHASALYDTKDVPSPRITSLMVKEKGKSGTPMVESKAPVCQANLMPTIIKSAGIATDTDYGRAYSEIGENEVLTRKYLFEKSIKVNEENQDEIVEYEITGPASDFANWQIKERHPIGYIYK